MRLWIALAWSALLAVAILGAAGRLGDSWWTPALVAGSVLALVVTVFVSWPARRQGAGNAAFAAHGH